MIFSANVGRHKAVELQLTRFRWTALLLYLDLRIHLPKVDDHAGVFFSAAIFGLVVEFNVYDSRHKEDYQ